MNIDDEFWSLSDPKEIKSQGELLTHLEQSNHLERAIYLPSKLRRLEDDPTVRIVDKTFKFVSFSKTQISGIIFRRCTFSRCQFIAATINDCEFHDCKFVSTNTHKISISNTYVDPLSFMKCLNKRNHQNIGSHLYHILLKNSRDEDQIRFERDARFLFLRWTRLQDAYRIREKWKSATIIERSEVLPMCGTYLLRFLWEKLFGSGVRIRYFVLSVIGVLVVFSTLNYCLSVTFGLMQGGQPLVGFLDALYFTVISLTTLGYGDIVPTTNCGRAFAAVQSVTGFILFALLASMLFRRVSP